jgi:hypothetical protein
VLIVNPGSPDGTQEYRRSVARGYPEMRTCEVGIPQKLTKNKGAMINAAFPSTVTLLRFASHTAYCRNRCPAWSACTSTIHSRGLGTASICRSAASL